MGALLRRVVSTPAPSATILVRLLVGLVFLCEGILKYTNPDQDGAGRFAKIGFSHPEFWAHFAGFFEIVCGALVVIGLLTRLASIPLLIVILTAIETTKIPILLDKGFWPMAHEARTDFSMTMGSLFLMIVGAGKISIDAIIARRLEGSA